MCVCVCDGRARESKHYRERGWEGAGRERGGREGVCVRKTYLKQDLTDRSFMKTDTEANILKSTLLMDIFNDDFLYLI